ncbi:hypothetical protein ACROYT_G042391 [Oculina patagonica]
MSGMLLKLRMEELAKTFNRYLVGGEDNDDDGNELGERRISFENGDDKDESDSDGSSSSSSCDHHEGSDFDEESHHLKISKIKDKALLRF